MKYLISVLVLFSTAIASADMMCVCKEGRSKCRGWDKVILENILATTLKATVGDYEFENSESINYKVGARGSNWFEPLKKDLVMFSGKAPWIYLSNEVRQQKRGEIIVSAANRGRSEYKCKKQ